MKKNNLDERQEQEMLKIEHNGCWLAFWGLLIAMVIQSLMGIGMRGILGEWITFMALALYMCFSCLKHGIWDRKLKANTTTNFFVSLIAGLVMMVYHFILIYNQHTDKLIGSLAAGVFMGGIVFVICFIILQLVASVYRKKRKSLEEEQEEYE